MSSDDHKTKGSGLAPWPARLTTPPPRLADFGYSSDMFEKDMVNEHILSFSIFSILAYLCVRKYIMILLPLIENRNYGGVESTTTGVF